MTHTYTIQGMTCSGCQATVHDAISKVPGVETVSVNLESNTADLTSERSISSEEIAAALPSKYSVQETTSDIREVISEQPSKLKQLRPLFLIFAYLFSAAILLNYSSFELGSFMMDFMGLFFVVFSFFKLLDLKGFPANFSMYDPLAKALPFYGWIYPFIEVGLGLMFLMRIETNIALIVTLVILGITTIGVTRSLLSKRAIKCACLGTALNLPMTEATFIENAIMIIMAIYMLVKGGALWL